MTSSGSLVGDMLAHWWEMCWLIDSTVQSMGWDGSGIRDVRYSYRRWDGTSLREEMAQC